MLITMDDLEKRALEKKQKLINAADFAAGLKEIDRELWRDAAGDLSRLQGVVDTMFEVSVLLASAPAVSAVHVVQCKDCRMWEFGCAQGNASIGICTVSGLRKVMFGDGFCSLADKK